MSLADVVRNAVGVAQGATRSLQGLVRHEKWLGDDGLGGSTYGNADPQYNASGVLTLAADTPGAFDLWPGVIEWKNETVGTQQGAIAVTRSIVTFLEPHDIDLRDRFVLPDGDTGPVLDLGGLVDPETGRAFSPVVKLG